MEVYKVKVFYLCELTRLQHANQRVRDSAPRRLWLNVSAWNDTRLQRKPIGLEWLHRIKGVLSDSQKCRGSLGS